MKQASLFCVSSAVLLYVLAGFTNASQSHHQAHVHGHGQLNVAIEDNTLEMELQLPAHDVLGFEKISSDKQRKQLKTALNLLSESSLWVFSEAAKCSLTHAQAFTSQGAYKSGHDHDHHHDHGDHHTSNHMDIFAHYSYQCQKPEALTRVKTTLFDLFAGTQTVVVQLLTVNGQQRATLTTQKTSLEL